MALIKANKVQLVAQLKVTIKAIEQKLAVSPEKIVEVYLVKYKNAMDDPENSKSLDKLLNCYRGYLETSSCWDQDFLNEMGKSEELIKAIDSL